MIERIQKLERMVKWLYCKVKDTAIGGIQSIKAGDNITVDNSDPLNPVVSSTGGGSEQNNIPNIITISLEDIEMTSSNTELEIQQALSDYIEGTDIDETELYEIKLIGFPDVVNSFVTTNTAQTIDEVKEFSKGFTIKGYKYFSDSAKNLTIAGKNIFGNNYGEITDSAIGIGNEIFPAMNLAPYDSETEPWNNKGYLGVGSALFINYIGNTNYRPAHNAHDSWVGVGRALGSGFIDGTNVTMIGTANMHKNDVDYADCVTVIGKGNSNGVTANGVVLDPNRVVTTLNGVSIRNLMSDIIMIGHENWIEDISNSTILGSNTRPYGYVFNSLILGSNHSNWNVVFNPTAPKVNLDNDVLIGNGVGKMSSRHAPSHNLVIGQQTVYGTGGTPNQFYRPLIEGRFKGVTSDKSASLQVNGILIAGHEKSDTDNPNETPILLEPQGVLPPGVTWNSTTNELSFDGTTNSGEIILADLVANTTDAVYLKLFAKSHNSGSWGYNFNNVVDGGNTAAINYTAIHSAIVTTNSKFKVSFADNLNAVMSIVLNKTDLTSYGTKPSIITLDSSESITNEIRTGTIANNHMSFGRDAGKFLYLGTDSMIFGNDAYAQAVFASNSIVFGHKAAKRHPRLSGDLIIGNKVLENATFGTGASTLLGNGIISKQTTSRIISTTAVGSNAFRDLENGNNNSGFGSQTSIFLKAGTNNLTAGFNSFWALNGSNNTILGGNNTAVPYIGATINNTIVIGANANPEVPNNTTTIGTIANTDNYLYGNIHAHAYKVRGGDGTKVLLDDGTTIAKTMLSNKMDYSLVEQNTGTKWIDGNWIFTITKLSTDPAPATDVRFPDEIVGLYTVYKYTKSA